MFVATTAAEFQIGCIGCSHGKADKTQMNAQKIKNKFITNLEQLLQLNGSNNERNGKQHAEQ
jgi:hypothetical protein